MLQSGMAEAVAGTLVEAGMGCPLDKGQILVERGGNAGGLYLIVSGALGVISDAASGARFITSVMTRGMLYGVISSLDGGPAANQIEALVPTLLWRIPDTRLRPLLQADPAVRDGLQRLLITRMRFMLETIDSQVHRDMRVRVASRLLHLDARLGEMRGEIDLPQQVVAWFVGLSRQRLNRELRELQKEGLIGMTQGRIEILDRDALARIGSEAPLAGPRWRSLPPRGRNT
jgi:CRP/FNR family cyclic AMP-dependent transcriptional regulator